MTVIQLNKTNLNDVPALLRALADRIEAGEETTDSLLVLVTGADNDWPTIYNYGRYLGNREGVGLLELAKVHLIDLARS